jgi:hypothetical protein
MIRFNFKLNNETHKVSIPSEWEEVKVRHYKKLEELQPTFDYEVLACFTDFDFKDFGNGTSKDDLFVIQELMSFLNDKTLLNKAKRKKRILMGDKLIKPPTKVELETIGQKSMAKPILNKYTDEERDPSIADIIDLCAIYFQPAYTGKFNPDLIPVTKQYIMDMYLIDIIPWFLFFFRQLSNTKIYGLLGLKLSLKTLKRMLSLQRREGRSLTNSVT